MLQTIVFNGDSETALFGWTNKIASDLSTRTTIINSAVPGMTSQWGLDNIQANILSHHPDIVFLEFSMNDATWLSLAQAKQNTEAMIKNILAENPHTKVYLITNNEPTSAAILSNPNVAKVDDYYQQYCGIANEMNIGLIDLNPGWKIIQEYYPAAMSDGYHPTLKADLVYEVPVIEEALELIGIHPALSHFSEFR